MKKIKAQIFLNVVLTCLSGVIVLRSLHTGELWRIVCACIGFVGFMFFSILLLGRLIKERK